MPVKQILLTESKALSPMELLFKVTDNRTSDCS